jgi:hypothetical protein
MILAEILGKHMQVVIPLLWQVLHEQKLYTLNSKILLEISHQYTQTPLLLNQQVVEVEEEDEVEDLVAQQKNMKIIQILQKREQS